VNTGHPVFKHPLVAVESDIIESIHNFVRQYNSHLYAGNDRGVDPDRLASLLAFRSKLSI
jgi:hypothetical protein